MVLPLALLLVTSSPLQPPAPQSATAHSPAPQHPVPQNPAPQSSRAKPLVAPPAVSLQAAPPAGGLFSANQLRQRCLSNVSADASYCFAYITGVHDTVRAYEAWLNQREFCVPRHVPQGDLREAFIGYLRDHASDVSGEAASVVVVALKIRYPCTTEGRAGPTPATRTSKP